MALVTWALYGIQEIGLMIEEPFRRSLSLHVFCNTIYTDVMETVQTLVPGAAWGQRAVSAEGDDFPEPSEEESNIMEKKARRKSSDKKTSRSGSFSESFSLSEEEGDDEQYDPPKQDRAVDRWDDQSLRAGV
eukprot:CAMPEP_0167803172 /NCGR_PEP_ID=MMETSP0111_2-20121227/19625_1 /TAXON_ID=91324 /ORGANISM="Lotharella globosa, Strain CCCM811" /LENGTH=131 /DNA_ID=CAMNT_0007699485 /DNA_START=101 /DNA_END=492 /DNA_ORIENTATION=-